MESQNYRQNSFKARKFSSQTNSSGQKYKQAQQIHFLKINRSEEENSRNSQPTNIKPLSSKKHTTKTKSLVYQIRNCQASKVKIA